MLTRTDHTMRLKTDSSRPLSRHLRAGTLAACDVELIGADDFHDHFA
jgi:hypothetical protein